MKNVYLAGPMRGIAHFNFAAFMAAAEHLRAQGYIVFNPAERDNVVHNTDISKDNHTGDVDQALREHGFNLRLALSADLQFICEEADGIVMLDGWESSKGACAELAAAKALGLIVIFFNGGIAMKTVTEQDFRMPEYRDAQVADYEFRPDGALVRKDRWEMGMRAVVSAIGVNARDGFEIDDVVRRVKGLMDVPDVPDDDWITWGGGDCPVDPDARVDFECVDGILRRRWVAAVACWDVPRDQSGAIVRYRVAK